MILLLICKIQFAFFRLENDLGEIETSSNFIASFYLKMCFEETSVVYPWYKLLSNAGGLWSVFLPLSAQKLMNEIVEETQRLANPIWQGYKQKGSVTPVCRYPQSTDSFQEEVSKDRKIDKKS